jgi:hypothetical protein
MSKKFANSKISFFNIAANAYFQIQRSTFIAFALMVFFVPVAWGEQQFFSINSNGQKHLLRSGNTEIRGNNLVQVQNEIFSLPVTNPGAEFGDLTGWSTFDLIEAVDSPGDAYSGDYYFGFYEPQSSFLLEPLNSKFYSFGEFTSETIDLSGLDQIQDVHVTAFTRSSDIIVSVGDRETEEIRDYPEHKIFWVRFYDIEGSYLSGVGFGSGSNVIGWEQRLESFRSFWTDEEWSALEPLIDHMTIGFETFFYAYDSEDDSFDEERYEIIS